MIQKTMKIEIPRFRWVCRRSGLFVWLGSSISSCVGLLEQETARRWGSYKRDETGNRVNRWPRFEANKKRSGKCHYGCDTAGNEHASRFNLHSIL